VDEDVGVYFIEFSGGVKTGARILKKSKNWG
jgi:hypothetical protein